MTKLQKQPKEKKPFYKKWYTWVIAIIIVIAATSGNEETVAPTETEATTIEPPKEAAPKAEEPKAEAPKEDNTPKEFKSALKKAEMYAKTMDMSKAAIHDQLVSEHGEKFSPEAAEYAMSKLVFDWNANALSKAKMYQDTMDMSVEAVRDQLVSDFGEKFTEEEATFAIENLDK